MTSSLFVGILATFVVIIFIIALITDKRDLRQSSDKDDWRDTGF